MVRLECTDEKLAVGLRELRDCRQITFVTLNRFCLLSNPPTTHPPLFLTENITRWIVYQTK